jgi:hypothetical protein
MPRPDVRIFAWLVPLALVLLTGWMFWADRCLDDEIARYWSTRSPPMAKVPARTPVAADEVVVENPYGDAGITNCCFLPNPERLPAFTLLFAITLLIGFLCARSFQQRAGTRAAVITFATLCLVMAAGQLAYVPNNPQFFEQYGYGTLLHAVFYLLLFSFGAGATAWLAARLTLRWCPRG